MRRAAHSLRLDGDSEGVSAAYLISREEDSAVPAFTGVATAVESENGMVSVSLPGAFMRQRERGLVTFLLVLVGLVRSGVVKAVFTCLATSPIRGWLMLMV
ncbi:hypothetical protein GCM10022224_102710 [Nonomuraea antimicrobica]|uniref:Uncharacterized protein n=1 Tax=Nonomuraea antimicrobica TaxID=561173 RepID=A0ABP7EJY3_9ACTN